MKVLVTGAGGLIGSEAVSYYLNKGCEVVGIDNNNRQLFFGLEGATWHVTNNFIRNWPERYSHYSSDIADHIDIKEIFEKEVPDAIIHCAAQPSHDKAASIVFEDFETNALGTLSVLEATRHVVPNSPFIHVSTNKVYGDNPNRMKIIELETRYDYAPSCSDGVDETMSLDNCTHSLFGVSKTTGDLYAQEYGRYFGLKTGIFRGGCLTGPQHSSVELHGFLSYIVKCAKHKRPYKVFGYKGKQVRDQIHSRDVISAFDEFIRAPRCGEVYNLGGCRKNSASVLETIELIEKTTGHRLQYEILPQNRVGDHVCYISNMSKFKQDYPNWNVTTSLPDIIKEIEANV